MGNKIAQVLFFKKFTNKFHRVCNARREFGNTFFHRKNAMCYFTGHGNESEDIHPSLARNVRKGYFAVYVGSERSRFIVPISYLNHPLFQELLQRAKEEYGYHHHMGLAIPCNRVDFEYVTSAVGKDSTVANMEAKTYQAQINIDGTDSWRHTLKLQGIVNIVLGV